MTHCSQFHFKLSNTGAKGIRCASTSWVAVGAGKLVDEVEAHLDIPFYHEVEYAGVVMEECLFDKDQDDLGYQN